MEKKLAMAANLFALAALIACLSAPELLFNYLPADENPPPAARLIDRGARAGKSPVFAAGLDTFGALPSDISAAGVRVIKKALLYLLAGTWEERMSVRSSEWSGDAPEGGSSPADKEKLQMQEKALQLQKDHATKYVSPGALRAWLFLALVMIAAGSVLAIKLMEMWKYSVRTDLAIIWLIMGGLVTFFAWIGGGIQYGLYKTEKKRSAEMWGEVTFSHLHFDDSTRTYYDAERSGYRSGGRKLSEYTITVEYQFNPGTKRTGVHILQPLVTKSAEEIEKMAEEYAPGRSVMVFYDPKNPENSDIAKGRGPLLMLVSGAALLVGTSLFSIGVAIAATNFMRG